MSTHANNVSMTVSGTPGTGTITLGSASSGAQSFASAYGANATVDVFITDGTAWEVARDCTYTHSGTTLTRGTLEASSTGSAISLTSAAVVRVAATADWGNRLEMQLDRAYTFIKNDGSTTQSLSSGASTKLAAILTTVVENPKTWWNTTNKRFTPPRAGNYLVTIGVQGGNTSAVVTSQLYKNGAFYANGIGYAASTYCTAQATFIVGLNGSTDYIEAYAYASTALTTNAAADNNYIQIIYLGP